jgi:hypothetical protein
MSGSRLLIAIEVLDFLRILKPREQRDLLKCFRDIASFPSKFSGFVEHDSAGRRVDVHVFGNLPLSFGMISPTAM